MLLRLGKKGNKGKKDKKNFIDSSSPAIAAYHAPDGLRKGELSHHYYNLIEYIAKRRGAQDNGVCAYGLNSRGNKP